MSRPSRFANCHPDRKHRANGLCNNCYMQRYRAAEQPKLVHGAYPQKVVPVAIRGWGFLG
jgi:hypothetical protein